MIAMRTTLTDMLDWLGRGAWSIIFYAYALFAAPAVAGFLSGAVEAGERHRGLGLAMLAAIALGLMGLAWNRHSFGAAKAGPAKPARGLMPMIVIAWILHCAVCIMMLFAALNCMGLDLPARDREGMGAFPFAVFLIGALAAEFAALYAMLAPLPASPMRWKAAASDIGLFVFSCAAYTFYAAVFQTVRADDSSWATFIAELAAITIMFLFFYLSIELPALLEALRSGKQSGWRSAIAMALILANAPLIRANIAEGGRFTSLEAAFKAPDRAVKLYLQNRDLDVLPGNIGELARLKILKLTENRLQELPESIGGLVDLEELHFSNNRLTRIPAGIGQMVRLRVLVGFQNYIRELPPELAGATNLARIHLSFNDLQSLTPAIGALANLQSLNLGWNALSNLPPEIGRLRALTDLNLNHNRLERLPSEISGLKRLRRLKLEGNPIRDDEKTRIRELLPGTDIAF